MNIYVGNLPRTSSEVELRKAFEAHGEVASCAIIKDKFTGESRGFGFVEMPNEAHGQIAINALNGTDFSGRPMNVNVAKPKTEGGRGGGGGSRW